MKFIGLVGKFILVLAFGLGILIATADDSEVAALDPHHPATFLPLVTSRLNTVESYVRNVRWNELLAAAGVCARPAAPQEPLAR